MWMMKRYHQFDNDIIVDLPNQGPSPCRNGQLACLSNERQLPSCVPTNFGWVYMRGLWTVRSSQDSPCQPSSSSKSAHDCCAWAGVETVLRGDGIISFCRYWDTRIEDVRLNIWMELIYCRAMLSDECRKARCLGWTRRDTIEKYNNVDWMQESRQEFKIALPFITLSRAGWHRDREPLWWRLHLPTYLRVHQSCLTSCLALCVSSALSL